MDYSTDTSLGLWVRTGGTHARCDECDEVLETLGRLGPFLCEACEERNEREFRAGLARWQAAGSPEDWFTNDRWREAREGS